VESTGCRLTIYPSGNCDVYRDDWDAYRDDCEVYRDDCEVYRDDWDAYLTTGMRTVTTGMRTVTRSAVALTVLRQLKSNPNPFGRISGH
jgi:hypothetical protein